MAVALVDEPRGVVAVDEVGDGLAHLVDGVVQPDPQALVFAGLFDVWHSLRAATDP